METASPLRIWLCSSGIWLSQSPLWQQSHFLDQPFSCLFDDMFLMLSISATITLSMSPIEKVIILLAQDIFVLFYLINLVVQMCIVSNSFTRMRLAISDNHITLFRNLFRNWQSRGDLILVCDYFDSWDNTSIIWRGKKEFYGSKQGSCAGRYSCHSCWYA